MTHGSRVAGLLGAGIVAVALGALGACGSDAAESDAGTVPAGPIAEDTFARAFEDAYCGMLATCCPGSGETYDDAACRTAAAPAYVALFRARAASGAYDAARARSCVDAVSAHAPACGVFVEGIEACKRVYATKNVGEACTRDDDCALSADGDTLCRSGACALVEPGADGSPCSPITGRCRAGLVCRGETCLPPVAEGTACGSSADAGPPAPRPNACNPDHHCPAPTLVCTAKRANGAACETDAECVGRRCKDKKCASRAFGDEACRGKG